MSRPFPDDEDLERYNELQREIERNLEREPFGWSNPPPRARWNHCRTLRRIRSFFIPRTRRG